MTVDIDELLRCPRSKQPLAREGDDYLAPSGFRYPSGDFRVALDWSGDWAEGQAEYEAWVHGWATEHNDSPWLLDEIDRDASAVYDQLPLTGMVLDVGGFPGLIVHHADVEPDRYVCIDPITQTFDELTSATPTFAARYPRCREVTQVVGVAEFLPLPDSSFDTVHMRSCLDHFASPGLALLEAFRVLRPGGKLVVGISLEGAYRRPSAALQTAPAGASTWRRALATWESTSASSFRLARRAAERVRLRRSEHDHHIFHPTYDSLRGIVRDHGFDIGRETWVPTHHNVIYVEARRREGHPTLT